MYVDVEQSSSSSMMMELWRASTNLVRVGNQERSLPHPQRSERTFPLHGSIYKIKIHGESDSSDSDSKCLAHQQALCWHQQLSRPNSHANRERGRQTAFHGFFNAPLYRNSTCRGSAITDMMSMYRPKVVDTISLFLVFFAFPTSSAKPVSPIGLEAWLFPSTCIDACESQWWNLEPVSDLAVHACFSSHQPFNLPSK